MGIAVIEDGEVVVQGDFLRQRLDFARKINDTFLWMIRKDFWAVLRGNQEYGGVLFHREVTYEEGIKKPKRIGYLFTPEGKIVVENLDRFNEGTGNFESVIVGEFSPCLLTARTGYHPRAPLYFWLPPNKANEEIAREEEIQALFNMVNESDLEAKEAKAQQLNTLRELNSFRRRLRDEERINEELRDTIDSIEPETTALRHRVDAMNTARIRDEATLEATLKQAEEAGRFRGLDGIDLTDAMLDVLKGVYDKLHIIASGMTSEQIVKRIDRLETMTKGETEHGEEKKGNEQEVENVSPA